MSWRLEEEPTGAKADEHLWLALLRLELHTKLQNERHTQVYLMCPKYLFEQPATCQWWIDYLAYIIDKHHKLEDCV